MFKKEKTNTRQSWTDLYTSVTDSELVINHEGLLLRVDLLCTWLYLWLIQLASSGVNKVKFRSVLWGKWVPTYLNGILWIFRRNFVLSKSLKKIIIDFCYVSRFLSKQLITLNKVRSTLNHPYKYHIRKRRGNSRSRLNTTCVLLLNFSRLEKYKWIDHVIGELEFIQLFISLKTFITKSFHETQILIKFVKLSF